MLDIDFTFLWTGVNLIILYLFLKKFLFQRVGKYMEDRAKAIEDDMQKAADLKSEGEAYSKEQQNALESARDEHRRIVNEAVGKAVREHDAMIESAKKEAAGIIASAHGETDREHEQMLKRLRGEIANKVGRFNTEFRAYIKENHAETAKNIHETGQLSSADEETIILAVREFKKTWK